MPEETHKTKDAEDYKSMIDDLNTNQLRDIQQCRMETDKLKSQVRMAFKFVPIFVLTWCNIEACSYLYLTNLIF